MQHATYASHLRYLDADDVDDAVVDFDGLDVRGRDDEKLGDIDGFVVDVNTGRVLHVVIDSGGWFRSRRFLLPIGHASNVDRDSQALRVDLTKDALRQYPEFDEERFRAFTDADLRAFEDGTAAACCPDESVSDAAAWAYDSRRHYSQPAWWQSRTWDRERLRPVEVRDRTGDLDDASRAAAGRGRMGRDPRIEHVRGRSVDGDPSPHFEGRAQPGDVLGIETGGERTSVGESAEDENERRRDAEREVAKQNRD